MMHVCCEHEARSRVTISPCLVNVLAMGAIVEIGRRVVGTSRESEERREDEFVLSELDQDVVHFLNRVLELSLLGSNAAS